MIDEKKLIEELTGVFIATYLDDDNGILSDTYDNSTVIDIINKQPKCGEWISCSDYFPNQSGIKDETELNVTMNTGEVTSLCWTSTPEGSFYDRTTDDTYSPYDDVIAWMPLPEPYKENRE